MVMQSKKYDEKKQSEIDWYRQKPKKGLINTIINLLQFYDEKRSSFTYGYAKKQMNLELRRLLNNQKTEKLLIAPCGRGNDYKFVKDLANHIYGIDLSPEAIEVCPPQIDSKTGDILNSGYPDNFFNIVVSPLFFHHLSKFGFEPFLRELYRILKKGGIFITLEPSSLYVPNFFTRPIKKIFRNPFGEVPDEGPFHPNLMLNALKRVYFKKINFRTATFAHHLFTIPVAKFICRITNALVNKSHFKSYGWLLLYFGTK